jgi:Fibronectin type III domain
MRSTKPRGTKPGPGRQIPPHPGRRGPGLGVPARVCLAVALLAGTLAFAFAPREPGRLGTPGGVLQTAPGAPTGLTATASGKSRVTLAWTAPASDGGASLLYYLVYEGLSPSALSEINSVPASATKITVARPPKGTIYYFAVSAENDAGLFGPTIAVPFPRAQTITFRKPRRHRVGARFALPASATSGLRVSFTSHTLGVCTVSRSYATTVGAGRCRITASQPGDRNWQAATPVTRSFRVKPAPGVRLFSGAPRALVFGLPAVVILAAIAVLLLMHRRRPRIRAPAGQSIPEQYTPTAEQASGTGDPAQRDGQPRSPVPGTDDTVQLPAIPPGPDTRPP